MPKNHRNVNEEYLPLINMKPGSDRRDFRRAPSVITDPQVLIFNRKSVGNYIFTYLLN